MLRYQVRYLVSGSQCWQGVRAFSASSARMIVEREHPGCVVTDILPGEVVRQAAVRA